MKILNIDDSKTFQMALEAILHEQGYSEVVMKNSVLAAIAYLKENIAATGDPGVDIILMDLIMPVMNGIEAVRLLKRDQELRDIPIVMVSALDEERQIEEAFEAGAADYIAKPIKKLELHARIRSIYRLKEERDCRKAREKELEETVDKLQQSIDEINTLNGLLPICSYCKKIRDDGGYWQQVESYVTQRSRASFSHSICPTCLRRHYPQHADKLLKEIETMDTPKIKTATTDSIDTKNDDTKKKDETQCNCCS